MHMSGMKALMRFGRMRLVASFRRRSTQQADVILVTAQPLLILQAASQAKVLGRDMRLEWLEHQSQDQVTANAVGAADAK